MFFFLCENMGLISSFFPPDIARAERYSHEVEDSEDMDDPDESALFSSFSSCSPRFRKVYSRVERELEEEHMLLVIV